MRRLDFLPLAYHFAFFVEHRGLDSSATHVDRERGDPLLRRGG